MLVSRPQGRALLFATAAVVLAMLQVPGVAAQTAPVGPRPQRARAGAGRPGRVAGVHLPGRLAIG